MNEQTKVQLVPSKAVTPVVETVTTQYSILAPSSTALYACQHAWETKRFFLSLVSPLPILMGKWLDEDSITRHEFSREWMFESLRSSNA